MEILIIICVGILILLGILAATMYNKFVKSKLIVEEAFSTMDVYLKKRFDLIPNILETTKGYAKHEKELFSQFAKARELSYGSMSMQEKKDMDAALTKSVGSLLAISESYPELKANENFMTLTNTLTEVEKDIEQARKYYNGSVRAYNTLVSIFPNNLFAGLFKFKKAELFEIEEIQRENIKIEF
jgi:LemA protein